MCSNELLCYRHLSTRYARVTLNFFYKYNWGSNNHEYLYGGVVIAQLILGPVADHYGFKQTAIPLVILLILASLLCAIAKVLIVFNLGRLLQAAAAGGLTVIGRASFSRHFSPQRALSLYVALVPAVAVLLPAIAPAIGGILTNKFGWKSIFIFISLLSVVLLLGFIFNYSIGKQKEVNTNLNPIFICKTYLQLLSNVRLLAYYHSDNINLRCAPWRGEAEGTQSE